jgi:integrase
MFMPDAIEAFEAEQRSLGLAERTMLAQCGFVRRLGKVCAQEAVRRGKRQPLKAAEIDGPVITAFFDTCAGGTGNRNNMLVALRKFLAWCEMQGAMPPGTPARLLAARKHKKFTRQPKHYIPVEQFGAALDISGERHPQDRIIMALALYTLCRSGEITGLRLKHVDLRAGTIKVYREKRQRWTDVAICPELNDELLAWLHWYATQACLWSAGVLLDRQPEWRLIPRLRPDQAHDANGRFYGQALGYSLDPEHTPVHPERVVKQALDVLGAQTVNTSNTRHLGEGMHTIRRSGARAMLDHLSVTLGQDRALIQVATMLDHEDPKQTLLYIGLDQEREQLNDWLRSNSMYGTGGNNGMLRQGNGRVVPLRGVPSDVRQSQAI